MTNGLRDRHDFSFVFEVSSQQIDPSNDRLLYCVDRQSASSNACRQRRFRGSAIMSWQLQCDVFSSRSSLWVAAVLMLALSGIEGQTAAASCGEHLQRMPQHVASNGTDDVRHQDSPAIPAIPCNGPGCRRGPVVPDTPTPADVRTSSFERLTVTSRPLVFCESPSDLPRDEVLLLQDGHRAGLDRPPRSV